MKIYFILQTIVDNALMKIVISLQKQLNGVNMRRKLRVGIAYDVKEDYSVSAVGLTHCDFSTLFEINMIKELLEARGHIVYLLGNYQKINKLFLEGKFPDIDIVMNTAEGIISRNREGWLPSLFEINNIPYSGSDAYALNLTLNKLHTKIIAEYLNIPTPPYYKVDCMQDLKKAAKLLRKPWILKPNYEGSSSGVMLANSEEELTLVFKKLNEEYNQTLLCETYVDGREFTVSLLYDGENTEVLGTVEIIRKEEKHLGIFSAKDKYSDTCTKIPAILPDNIIDGMQNDATKLHRFLNCNDYSRADYRVDSNGQYYLLELTPLPNVDYKSGFAKCCEYGKHNLGKVLEEILYNALQRYRNKQNF